MRPFVIGTAVTLGIGTLAGSAATPPATSPEAGSVWITDFGKAREVARKSRKPIFLVFR